MRTAARTIAIVGVLLGVLAVRVVTSSRAELASGDQARARSDTDAAIQAYHRAARWYAPGNPYSTQALSRLEEIARAAEVSGDREMALVAWRAERGAILASRSVFVPHAERRERAERAIVALTEASAPDAEHRRARARAEAAFARPIEPALGWSLLALLGWIAWTTGAFCFAVYAIDEEDRIRSRPARAIGTVIVIGFGLFVIGMALAG